MLNKTINNQTTAQAAKNQALILEQEILATFLKIINFTANPAQTSKDIQQDFIGHFDTGDYDYLRDGNVILTEIQSLFVSLSLASPEALDIIDENNQNRLNKVSHLLNV